MAKNLVLTIAVGSLYEKMAELTHPSIKKYADKIGADFLSINENYCSTPHWEKFQVSELLNTYERIIYLDTDIIVREDAPNLFDVVPGDMLALFNEMPFTPERQFSLMESCKDYGIRLKNWDGRYFNTGVMVIPRTWKSLFIKPEKEIFNYYEQGYLNAKIHEQLESVGNEMRVFDLEYKYNRMACMDSFTGEERFASYFIHYAGFPNVNFVMDLIARDLQTWENSKAHNFKYQRHIILDVQGGLGDQVEAQPGIRYLVEHIYPGDDINVLTHYPVLFKDIAGIKVFLHGKFERQPDTPYYSINTLPGPNTTMWSIVSNLLCHTADYCAMAMLRRTLPNKDKNIILNVDPKALENIKKMCGGDPENIVLVHAGKHWESKTFPEKYWQDIVDGLHKEGMKVCLIGKNELTRGVAPVVARDGMIDLRDLLSLEEFIAILSTAKILLSNDSSPIHLAGAFDNWIFLIPSCKHPDHILPYRNGVQNYKTKSLYKRLVLDDTPSAPTEVHGSSGQYIYKDWSNYLPEVDEVISAVKTEFK
jgi:hypothetical protein